MATMRAVKLNALFILCALFVFNLNGFPPIECHGIGNTFNETQKAALRDMMRMVLKIDPPSDAGNGSVPLNSENRAAKLKVPKYIMDLYETVQDGEIIRGIEPIPDFVPHFKDIIVYNMTSIAKKMEKIKTAELHIFRRRLMPQKGRARKRLLPPPCRVRLYQLLTTPGPSAQPSSTGNSVETDVKELSDVERTKLRSLDFIPVAQVTKGGWHTIDISMAIKEMINSPGSATDFILGVRFEGPKGKAIATQRFLKQPDINDTSSYIIIYSEDTHTNDVLDNMTMSDNQIDIIVELLQNSAGSEFNKKNEKTKKRTHKNKNEKPKIKKFESIKSIRHGKKYYDNTDDYNEISEKKGKYSHRFSKLPPGNGDISELLDYDNINKVRAMRRHNHKTINSLNLRYDTVTRSVVPKRVDKLEYDDEMIEGRSLNRSRRTRSTNDRELDIIEFTGDEKDVLEIDEDGVKIVKLDKEDDMGDLSYYEPDVYLHEDLIPKSYRHKKHIEENIKSYTIADGSGDEDYIRFEDLERVAEKPRGDKHRHKNQKRKNKKYRKMGIDVVDSPASCRLSTLLEINLAEIGFSNIILPDNLNFTYCTGTCPTTKVSNTPSSVFQNIVRTFYGIKKIPKPCCVAKSTSRLSMLVIEHQKTIIKHYSNILIDSCECR